VKEINERLAVGWNPLVEEIAGKSIQTFKQASDHHFIRKKRSF